MKNLFELPHFSLTMTTLLAALITLEVTASYSPRIKMLPTTLHLRFHENGDKAVVDRKKSEV